jgi:hypothetical protein
MGASVSNGGFVATTKTNNFVGHRPVDDETFKKIAVALGIPDETKRGFDSIVSEIVSIYIYRGK